MLEVLSNMESISLDEMGMVQLMNRTDTKYLLDLPLLQQLSIHWPSLFCVQEIDGRRVAHYKNLYFDTEDARTYTVHHNRQLRRQKIRQREYVDSGICFCEIKNKINTGRTQKVRVKIAKSEWGTLDAAEMSSFVKEHFWITDRMLSPRLQNGFERITLVNHAHTERVTIDQSISFRNLVTDVEADVSGLVVAEVKRDGRQPSDFVQLLQQYRVRPQKLSKYVLGMLLTDEHIKYNRFKPKIRYVSKLIGKELEIKAQKAAWCADNNR